MIVAIKLLALFLALGSLAFLYMRMKGLERDMAGAPAPARAAPAAARPAGPTGPGRLIDQSTGKVYEAGRK